MKPEDIHNKWGGIWQFLLLKITQTDISVTKSVGDDFDDDFLPLN